MSKKLKTAIQLYDAGKYSEALAEIRKSTKPTSDHFYLAGLSYHKLKELELAQQLLYKCLNLKPNHKESAGQIALIYESRNQPDKAIEFANYALQIDKKYTKALNIKARSLIRLGSIREGINLLEQSLQIKAYQPHIIGLFITHSIDANPKQVDIALIEKYLRKLPKAVSTSLLDDVMSRLILAGFGHIAGNYASTFDGLISTSAKHGTQSARDIIRSIKSTNLPKTQVANFIASKSDCFDPLETNDWCEIITIVKETRLDIAKLLMNYRQISPEQSKTLYATALEIKPIDASIQLALARIEFRLGNSVRSMEILNQVPKAILKSGPALFLQSEIALVNHDFNVGWAQYFFRPNNPITNTVKEPTKFVPKEFIFRLDQGVGDNLFQSLVIPWLIDKGFKPIVHCKYRLKPIFQDLYPSVNFITSDEEESRPLDARDFACIAMASLTDLKSIQSLWEQVNTESLVARLNQRTAGQGDSISLGISWRSDNTKIGFEKSLGLRSLIKAIAGLSHPLHLVSLQYKLSDNEITKINSLLSHGEIDVPTGDLFEDLWAAFSAVQSCDFVVTCSNINAHIAGLLGKPCLLIIPNTYEEIWYWKMSEKISDWYPSITILREPDPKKWGQAIQNLITT